MELQRYSMIANPVIARKLASIDAKYKKTRAEQQSSGRHTELSRARFYVGDCKDMCPERERLLRFGNQVSMFEKNVQTNETDEYAMTKEYRRAGADQEEPLSFDLRTPEALQTTMDFLVCNIMDDPRSKNPELTLEWYDYLWDRLRAIRKDITQQNFCDQQSAILVERCTRFHIHACYAMNHVKDFDLGMNKRNLNDCLQMLRQMYADLRTGSGIVCPGELDFLKYDILLHLDEDYSSTNVLLKTSDHRSSEQMKLIRKIFQAYTNNDYYNFFKLMKLADYMTSCILSLFVNKVRMIGLKIIVSAFPSKQIVSYPADLMIETLAFDDLEDLRSFVNLFNVDVIYRDSKHYIPLYRDLINSVRQLDTTTNMKSKILVENKMKGSPVGQLIYGSEPLPPNPYGTTPERLLLTQSDEDEVADVIQIEPSLETNSSEEDDKMSYHSEDDSPLVETTCDSQDFNPFKGITSPESPISGPQIVTRGQKRGASDVDEVPDVIQIEPSLETDSSEEDDKMSYHSEDDSPLVETTCDSQDFNPFKGITSSESPISDPQIVTRGQKRGASDVDEAPDVIQIEPSLETDSSEEDDKISYHSNEDNPPLVETTCDSQDFNPFKGIISAERSISGPQIVTRGQKRGAMQFLNRLHKRSASELADLMPAGRVRNINPTTVKFTSVQQPTIIPVQVTPPKKPISQEQELNDLNSSIAEERKANEKFYKLIRLLI